MIPKECKRLAEVDFPIAEVSRHAAREKSIRHGHPSTLHLWWARRPLASSRAVLLALLWPDPCDALCPEEFKVKARELLPQALGKVGPTDQDLRKAVLKFIADFANWDLAANRTYIEVSRALVKAAHGEEPPLVVDPFAGGGSIPLEALRLGCDAFASDLNPVACLILKVMLEDIPRHGPKLAEDLRRVGAEIKKQAEKDLADLYPKDPDGATPIAYLWARTVRCESPNCGAEILLARSFWLCRKASRKRALRHRVVRPAGEPPRVEFEVFEPKVEKEVPGGTVTRARATCVACSAVLPPARVRAQLAAERGGADVVFDAKGRRTGGVRMLAVVTLRPGEQGRHYRLPTERDYEGTRRAQERLAGILGEWERAGKRGLCPVPDEPLPAIGTLGFRVQRYGMLQWGDLFTARQKVALLTLARAAYDQPQTGDDAIRTAMAMVVDRSADYGSSGVVWAQTGEFVAHTFGRQALRAALPEIAHTLDRLFQIGDQGVFEDGLREIDLGAGHSSSGETLCGRVLTALTSEALLNESVGAGYLERNWPPALKESGAWPLASLRQSFLNGSLTRLIDPDAILKSKIVEFVSHGDFGLASGRKADGSYERVWFEEFMAPDEVAFEGGVFLLRKATVGALKSGVPVAPAPTPEPEPPLTTTPAPGAAAVPAVEPGAGTGTLRLVGTVPPEVWNRLGTKILPKLRSGSELRIGLEFTVTVKAETAAALVTELRQILQELGLADAVRVETSGPTS